METDEGGVFRMGAGMGDLKTMQRCIMNKDRDEECAILNGKGANGETAMHLASKGGHIRIVEWLNQRPYLAKECPLDRWLWSPLHLAAFYGHTEVVKALISSSQNYNAEDRCYDNVRKQLLTPLHLVAREGHLETATCLLEHLGKVYAERPYPAIMDDKCSPLHLAAKQGHHDLVQILIRGDREATYYYQINALDSNGNTALHLAVHHAQLEVVKTLLRDEIIEVNLRSGDGLTPLHLAAQSGSPKLLHLLVEHHKIDVNARSHPEAFTPLHMAANSGHHLLVRMLLGLDRTIINARDIIGRTPLHYASRQGHYQVIETLLKVKTNTGNVPDNDGMTPLHLAARESHIRVVGQLRSKGNINAMAYDSIHQTQLFDLVFDSLSFYGNNLFFPRPRLMDSTFRKTKGFTALHFAARHDNMDVVREILKEPGLDLFIKDEGGFLAYDWCRVNGNGEIFLQCLDKHDIRDAISVMGCRIGGCLNETPNLHVGRMELSEEKRKVQALDSQLQDKFQKIDDWPNISWAVRNGSMDWVKWFASQEECILDRDGKLQWVVLDCLKHLKHFDTVSLLLMHSKMRLDHKFTMVVIEQIKAMEEKDLRSIHVEQFEELLKLLVGNGEWSGGQLFDLLCWAIQKRMKRLAEQLVLDQRTTFRKTGEDRIRPFTLAKKNGDRQLVELMLERSDVIKELYSDRQIYVDSCNTILVGAALIAGIAYQGWLQPPPGNSLEYDNKEFLDIEERGIELFWWCNSFAFYLAIATVIAGVTGSIPFHSRQIMHSVDKIRWVLTVACTLLALSLISITLAFVAIGMASLPPHQKYKKILIISATLGGAMCALLLFAFNHRLAHLITSYSCRNPFHSLPMEDTGTVFSPPTTEQNLVNELSRVNSSVRFSVGLHSVSNSNLHMGHDKLVSSLIGQSSPSDIRTNPHDPRAALHSNVPHTSDMDNLVPIRLVPGIDLGSFDPIADLGCNGPHSTGNLVLDRLRPALDSDSHDSTETTTTNLVMTPPRHGETQLPSLGANLDVHALPSVLSADNPVSAEWDLYPPPNTTGSSFVSIP